MVDIKIADRKNPTAVQIGQRIKQARKMAGLGTAGQLLARIPNWGTGRLGNYEAGISMPSPDDVKIIADITEASPCWIMFGIGPIRSTGRDIQAIRHQNFLYLFLNTKTQPHGTNHLLKATGLSRNKVKNHLNNPFLEIPQRIAAKIEKFADKQSGWMDQQHVESDPVCAAFPDDMRHIMTIVSNLSDHKRRMFLQIAEVFGESDI